MPGYTIRDMAIARTVMGEWILTIPISALIGFVSFAMFRLLVGS